LFGSSCRELPDYGIARGNAALLPVESTCFQIFFRRFCRLNRTPVLNCGGRTCGTRIRSEREVWRQFHAFPQVWKTAKTGVDNPFRQTLLGESRPPCTARLVASGRRLPARSAAARHPRARPEPDSTNAAPHLQAPRRLGRLSRRYSIWVFGPL